MAYLITPPGAFGPTTQWQNYLDRLKSELPQNDPSVKAAIRQAEEELRSRSKAPNNRPQG